MKSIDTRIVKFENNSFIIILFTQDKLTHLSI
jgi:hypothetical protein